MKILCITHADFETPGVIEDWAKENKYDFMVCKPYKGEELSEQSDFDFLIVMGGPQSPLKIKKYPYLGSEISFIRKAIHSNKGIFGFCLGAQLIGEAMDATTARSPHKEIGVFPITLTIDGKQDPLLRDLPPHFPVIHWHNDMPGETSDSVLLAYSEGCPRQILRYSPRIYGFQCHLEITREGIEKLIDACPEDLQPGQFTQTASVLLEQDYESINQSMKHILNKFTSLLRGI